MTEAGREFQVVGAAQLNDRSFADGGPSVGHMEQWNIR